MRLLRSYWWVLPAIAGAAVYFLVDPAVAKWMPQCGFKRFTGFDCPGCGSQRALHALLHADFAAAWHFNAALIVAIPILVFLGVVELLRTKKPELYYTVYTPWLIWLILALVIGWWIGRNIAGI